MEIAHGFNRGQLKFYRGGNGYNHFTASILIRYAKIKNR